MPPIISYLCISSWKQVHLFFLHLQWYMQACRDWKKAFCKFYRFRKTLLLANSCLSPGQGTDQSWLCSENNLHHYLPWNRMYPLVQTSAQSLISNWFFHSSDTEFSNMPENFCSANEPRFWSVFSHLPSCNFGLSIFSHSWKKHPIVCLFCSGSTESQVWRAAIKAQPAETTPGKGEQLTWGQVPLWALILPLPWNRGDTQN